MSNVNNKEVKRKKVYTQKTIKLINQPKGNFSKKKGNQ